MAAKKKPLPVETVDNEDYTRLEMWSIQLNEMYKAHIIAGFNEEQALYLITAPFCLPDWMQPADGIGEWEEPEDDDFA
jgi:hypothetical protein